MHSQRGGDGNRVSHRFPEAIVLIDVAILREPVSPVAQSHPAPDAFGQLPGLDVVHFARLTVLKDDALARSASASTIILWGKQAQMYGSHSAAAQGQSTRHPVWVRLTSTDRSSSSRGSARGDQPTRTLGL